MELSEIGMPPTGSPQQTPKRPDWMRPAFTSPDEFMRKGMIPMRRIKDWPREAKTVPEELITGVRSTTLTFTAANILPPGVMSLFAICTAPLAAAMILSSARRAADNFASGHVSTALVDVLLVLLSSVPPLLCLLAARKLDFQTGNLFVAFDRRRRKVYQLVSKKVAKGEWDWDKLVPYASELNRLSAINQALTFVEFDENTGQMESFFVAHVVGGSNPAPLADTYAFLREFMESGVTKLPSVTLSTVPLPAWYLSMPPWFFGLPREWAKSIWAFFFLLFAWPVIVWARIFRHVQPYNHWPAERVAQWQADAADASPQEKQWIADNVKPAPNVPLAARIGFALAVIVSSPVWWSILTGYIAILAK